MMRFGPVGLLVQFPQLRTPIVGSLIGRLPLGIATVAVLLSVQTATGSTRISGMVSAAATIGVAVGSPVQARLLDRLHRKRVLATYAAAQVLALCALAIATILHLPPAPMVALSALFGLSIPSLTAMTKWVLRSVVDPDQLGGAFALDASTLEFLFIIGPSIAAASTAYLGPASALFGCAACILAGTTLFLRSCDDAWLTPPGAGSGSPAERDRPGAYVAAFVSAMALMAMSLGLLELAITHLTVERHTSVTPVGIAFSAMSVGSLLGGLVYGSIRWRGGLAVRYAAMAVGNAALVGLLVFLPSFPVLYVEIACAGLFLAPLFSLSAQLLDRLSSQRAWMQSQTWGTVAGTGGQAAGAAVGGTVAAAHGSAVTFALSVTAVLLAVVAATPALLRSRTAPADRDQPPVAEQAPDIETPRLIDEPAPRPS